MWPRALLGWCALLAVTSHAHAQYIDFFQNLNAFLQPFGTTKSRSDVTKRPETKHRQTNKQKYEDIVFFEADDAKERGLSRYIDFHTSTAKPRRKNTKTTSHTTSLPDRNVKTVNKIVSNNRNEQYNVDRNNLNDRFNNYDYNNVRQTTQRTTNYNTKQSTTRTTEYNNRQTTGYERTTHRPNNWAGQTTRNPLLNRPGVRPAAVDENRPPITNRPVTRPYDTPFNSDVYRPANTRPPFETERPWSDSNRPATRPPFEPVRPVSPGNGPVAPGTGDVKEPDIEIGPDEDDMSEVEKRRYYELCEQKCSEYKASGIKKVVALPLAPQGRGVELNVSACARHSVPLIVGGAVADIRSFPHMALVGWRYVQRAGYSWKCGGSLVSARFVLTAGHCTYHDKDYNVVSGPPHAVQVGSSLVDGKDATVVTVALIVRHPKYKLRRSYYDVALIKLSSDLRFSERVRAACVGAAPAVGAPVVATGWGKTEFGGDSSPQLRSVSLPIWDMAECREIWGTSRKLPNGPMADSQLCAGERRGAKDTCQGDSGGPAQVEDGCAWRVVAVTSVGRACGARATPALYARVPRAFVAAVAYAGGHADRGGSDNTWPNSGRLAENTGWANNNNERDGNGSSGNTDGNRWANNNGRDSNGNNNRFGNDGRSTASVYGNRNAPTFNDQGRNEGNRGHHETTKKPTQYGLQSDVNNWNNRNNDRNIYTERPNSQHFYYDDRNGYERSKTSNGYSDRQNYNNNYGQNNYDASSQNGGRNTENTYETQSYGYNDNGRPNNDYNGYNNYDVERPWWQR